MDAFYNSIEMYSKDLKIKLKNNEEWFKNLWDNNATRYEFFELARVICPGIDEQKLEDGWQYRIVLHPDYEESKCEFLDLLMGWY
jgi:hypothetical protein